MNLVCRDCGTVAEPSRAVKGSIWIEVILWLCFIVPGLIYSIWRMGSKHDACPACGSTSLVPVDTPIGRSLAPAAADQSQSIRRPSPAAVSAGRALGRMARKLKG